MPAGQRVGSAGALRDNGRAHRRSRTFGKGSVQTLMPLDNGDSVKLTTARYYTPDGKSIQRAASTPTWCSRLRTHRRRVAGLH